MTLADGRGQQGQEGQGGGVGYRTIAPVETFLLWGDWGFNLARGHRGQKKRQCKARRLELSTQTAGPDLSQGG